MAEWYRRIRDLPLTPIRSALTRLDPGEKLFLVSRAHFLFREKRFPRLRLFAFGRALLTDRRLLFKGKAGIRLDAPLAELDSLSVEPGDKLHFVFRGLLYRIPFRRESPLKWMDALQTLRASGAGRPRRSRPGFRYGRLTALQRRPFPTAPGGVVVR